ncbi:hypothetical protein HGQ98_03045 [Achromobacter ruhlandii]|uniref:Uncharacterized protein n=1 Tax=Achromobacter ruhlandii TaxID=72557 RepID=A0A848ND82_9BURK|nr:hypothetical protein [Achromobacter ruhlandii]NMU88860.1 hypothetical protein [Achromobacter ruhlandii]
MNDCDECRDIVQGQAGAQGHARLISLGDVRSLAVVKGRARLEAFVCSTCAAEWDYIHATRGERAGWFRQ